MKKYFYLLLLSCFTFLFLSVGNIQAVEIRHVNIVNPIRGGDFWEHKHNLLETPRKQYEIISKNNMPATWLVRYDVFNDSEITNFLKSFSGNQEVGLFMEVTPSLTTAAGVKYNQSPNWHYVQSVLLVGYSSEDRKRLIDTAFNKYREVFGKYPKSVGAWWIDAPSLDYMREKYQIEANLDVSDQYSTDQYQVWGQYWSVPFYPAKKNALMPAQAEVQKIGVVTIQWAPRDPLNGYGSGVNDSTYSVQANDYLLHDLDIKYFEKLLNIYPQLTVGLENDFGWNQFGKEFTNQLELLSRDQKQGKIVLNTMAEYSAYYKKQYPKLSPAVLIDALDPLGSSSRVVWYQTSKYRVGWFYNEKESAIRDLRMFNATEEEPCSLVACPQLNFAYPKSKPIDDVTFSTKWVIDEGRIKDLKVETPTSDSVQITYLNQSGIIRTIKFFENDIQVDQKIDPVSFAIIQALSKPSREKLPDITTDATVNYGKVLPSLTLNLSKFLLLTLLFFFLPGWILSRKVVFAIPIGFCVFTLLVFALGYLKLDSLIWGLPLVSSIFFLKKEYRKLPLVRITKKSLIVTTLITLGSITWLATTFGSGLSTSIGYQYWGPNGHDGIWHLSLINELQKGVPPNNPIFAGEKLNNYHYFYDLLLARSASLFSLDNQDVLFRFFPLLIAPLIGLATLELVRRLLDRKNDKAQKLTNIAGLASIFFVYFGGSFGWVVMLLREKVITGGESLFWSMQSISTLLNPPFAVSLLLILVGLCLLKDLVDKKTHPLIPLVIIFGTLIEFKAYGGVLILAGLSIYALERLLLKKDINVLLTFVMSAILSAVVFLPNNIGGSSLFVFSPFWFITSMLDFQDRLFLPRLSLTIQSGVSYKVFAGLAIGTVIFFVGNLGSRIIGLFAVSKIQDFRILLYLAALGFIIPLLFIQTGTNWNSIQFFYYTIFIFNILAGITTAYLFQRLKFRWSIILAVLIVILTIPTTLGTLTEYTPTKSPAYLSQSEIDALNFLRNQPDGIVLTMAYDQYMKGNFEGSLPLLAYTSTSYISAFSKKTSFVEDQVNLDILGLDYKGRINAQKDFVKNRENSQKILKDNNISYVYVPRIYQFNQDEEKRGIKKIFENKEVEIFRVL